MNETVVVVAASLRDLLDLLDELRTTQRRDPPRWESWAVVLGDDDIVLRPPNRQLGRFRATVQVRSEGASLADSGQIEVRFYNADLGQWTATTYLVRGYNAAGSIFEWCDRTAECALGWHIP